MVRIVMGLAFAALGLLVSIWKRREARIGPQERRLKAGNVRVPPSIGARHRPNVLGAWVFYAVLSLGGLMLICFFIMKIVYGYDAVVLMDRGQRTVAEVHIGGLPREDCHYEFSANGGMYHGRGPERLDQGSTLKVLYDPINPKRNRPADGLLLYLITAAFFAGLMVVAVGAALIPRRRFRGHDAALVGQLQEKLKAAAFIEAIATFRAMEESARRGSVLALADAITTVCCARGDQDVYERGQEAIQILTEDEPDPAFQRELVYYHQEIVASREICSHHQPAAGQAI